MVSPIDPPEPVGVPEVRHVPDLAIIPVIFRVDDGRLDREVPVGEADFRVHELQALLENHGYHRVRDAEPDPVWGQYHETY